MRVCGGQEMVKGLGVNHCPIDGDEAPTFAARKGVLRRNYHIMVVWPDGRRLKLGYFLSRSDAARWIEQKSADWLTKQHAANNKNQGAIENASL